MGVNASFNVMYGTAQAVLYHSSVPLYRTDVYNEDRHVFLVPSTHITHVDAWLLALDSILWADSAAIPAYVAVASAVLVTAHAIFKSLAANARTRSELPTLPNQGQHNLCSSSSLSSKLNDHGGIAMFAFTIARAMGCIVLFVLSLISLAHNTDDVQYTSRALQTVTFVRVFHFVVASPCSFL